MAEIKSTMDLVMERAARIGKATSEDLQQDEAQKKGMQLTAEYLEGTLTSLVDVVNSAEKVVQSAVRMASRGKSAPIVEPARVSPRRESSESRHLHDLAVLLLAHPQLGSRISAEALSALLPGGSYRAVIDALLSDGRSSRLVRELVDRQHLAASVSTANGIPGARYANLFAVFATPVAGAAPAAVEEAVERELQRLASEPPTPVELQRVLRRLQAARIRSLDSNSGLARNLAYFQTVAGDWRYMVEHAGVIAGITAEEVVAAVHTYLVPENRTTAVLVPTSGAAGVTGVEGGS